MWWKALFYYFFWFIVTVLNQQLTDVYFVLQIQGLGVDGAKCNAQWAWCDVAGLLKRGNPVHCVCHILHLADSKAATAVQNVDMLQKIAENLYQHINNSPNRLAKFQNMARLLAVIEDGNGFVSRRGGKQHTFLQHYEIREGNYKVLQSIK